MTEGLWVLWVYTHLSTSSCTLWPSGAISNPLLSCAHVLTHAYSVWLLWHLRGVSIIEERQVIGWWLSGVVPLWGSFMNKDSRPFILLAFASLVNLFRPKMGAFVWQFLDPQLWTPCYISYSSRTCLSTPLIADSHPSGLPTGDEACRFLYIHA